MGKNEKAWEIGFKRLIGDASLGEAWGIAVGDTNKQLHILNINDADTDWALSADSYPSVYIHGSASATEYIKVYTDSTDAHFQAVGANVVLDAPTSGDITLQVNSTDEYVFNATTLNMGSNTITNVGAITMLDGAQLSGTNTVINSTNALAIEIAEAELLSIDDAAISLTAGSAAVGTAVYIASQTGGTSATYGGAGASIYLTAGNGGISGAGTGAAGGNIYITAGTASDRAGTGAANGTGGDIVLLPGDNLGTTASPGYLKVDGSASWTSASAGTVTITLRGPGSSGSLLCYDWLTVKNDGGTVLYVPGFIVVG